MACRWCGFEQGEIGQRRFEKLVVRDGVALELAGVEGVAGDLPLIDGVGRVELGM